MRRKAVAFRVESGMGAATEVSLWGDEGRLPLALCPTFSPPDSPHAVSRDFSPPPNSTPDRRHHLHSGATLPPPLLTETTRTPGVSP